MTTPHPITGDFTPENPYAGEAKERWGTTDAYKQSQERVKKFMKEDWDRIGQEAGSINKDLLASMQGGKAASDPTNMPIVARHYAWLRNFYEPSLDMYRGLASMYVEDPRFAANYDKYAPGFAVYVRDAMHAFCDMHK
jgi:MerR family transcriptional regulator, thiopeptide resistance regulator